MIAKAGKKAKAQVERQNGRSLGICVTCNSVDVCAGRATWMGPVFWCEQFDDLVDAPPDAVPR